MCYLCACSKLELKFTPPFACLIVIIQRKLLLPVFLHSLYASCFLAKKVLIFGEVLNKLHFPFNFLTVGQKKNIHEQSCICTCKL